MDSIESVPLLCSYCGSPIPNPTKKQQYPSRRNTAVCNRECQNAKLSKRRKEYNPMRDRADVRAKASAKLRAMGWKPVSRGGNGKPLPVEHQLLASALGWPCEVVVHTFGMGEGFPPSYKIDIASRELLIGIEVDGFSHSALARKAQDIKKQNFLEARGWKIIRFKNKEIATSIENCIARVLELIK